MEVFPAFQVVFPRSRVGGRGDPRPIAVRLPELAEGQVPAVAEGTLVMAIQVDQFAPDMFGRQVKEPPRVRRSKFLQGP